MISVSIVCATIDSASLVESAMRSVAEAASNADVSLQIIVVDQSPYADCVALPQKFPDLGFLVIHSLVRGLSYCRNIGLRHATGDFLIFWDADCVMDREFFSELRRLVDGDPRTRLFYGSIKSPGPKTNVFRDWPSSERAVSKFYRWQLSTSVNCVWRNDAANCQVKLDERFGIGGTYGSCEDVDFFLQLSGPAIYSPSLIVYHPEQNVNDVPLAKSSSYSFGFGALCRKHVKGYGVVYLVLTITKKIYQVARGQVKIVTGMVLIKERLRGFFAFS
jgi:glycosyltransferase involved in cell wall biosynthesis